MIDAGQLVIKKENIECIDTQYVQGVSMMNRVMIKLRVVIASAPMSILMKKKQKVFPINIARNNRNIRISERRVRHYGSNNKLKKV